MVGCFVLVGTALASTFSVTKIISSSGHVKKTLVVGTNRNKGKLLVKGFLRNPVKGKVLRVKDSMKVTGNLRVKGILQGSNIVSSDNLGTGVVTETKVADGAVTGGKIADGNVSSGKIADDAVTSSKVDMTMNGVVKAGAYITVSGVTPTVQRSFNNLISSNNVTASRSSYGVYVINFGTDISERYYHITLYDNSDPASSDYVIQAIGTNSITVHFWGGGGADYDPPGFFVSLY